jgi:UDP-glucose 4-epimerase
MQHTALVTGGAGYIGSHVGLALLDAGWRVVVLDDLSAGHRFLTPPAAKFVEGNVGDAELLHRILRSERIEAVLHFAGSIVVEDSVTQPIAYYRNNLENSIGLIEACLTCGIKRLVFSSTAAVYGDPERVPVTESAPTRPLNPYGQSKLMVEQVLRDVDRAHRFPHVALRYFNVAGADPAGRSGQAMLRATHLIKVACEVAVGVRPEMEIFGTDYDTPDGTAIRDYIHVTDLAEAHVRALEYLLEGGESLTLNCGYGHGFSVREVLKVMEEVAGRPIAARPAPRRAGDSPKLVADSRALQERFRWQPRHNNLQEITASALAWERRIRQLNTSVAQS